MTGAINQATSAYQQGVEQGSREALSRLREQVKKLPVSDDDGLWIQTEVLRLIDGTSVASKVTTVSEGPDRMGRAPSTEPDPSPTAVAALNGTGHTGTSG